MRERMPQLQSSSTGSGNTMNQCSTTASAISVARRVKPTASKADASDASARATSAAVMMVEPVMTTGNRKLSRPLVKKLVRYWRWLGQELVVENWHAEKEIELCAQAHCPQDRQCPRRRSDLRRPRSPPPPQHRKQRARARGRGSPATAYATRRHPEQPSGQGSLRGPVKRPSKNPISKAPQSAIAHMKAR